MKFEVMSKFKAKEMSFKSDIDDCIIISIASINYPKNEFNTNIHIKDILFLNFDDTEFNEPNHITTEDTNKILNFVKNYINIVDKIIVHCDAGISRSAGVCAALMKIINNDDSPIFDNPRFCPNMTCYRTVLETYYNYYDENEANKKLEHNIEIWRKYNID